MTDEQRSNEEEAAAGMHCGEMASGHGGGCCGGNMGQMGEQGPAGIPEMMSQMMAQRTSGEGDGCGCGCGGGMMEEMMGGKGQDAFMAMMLEMMSDEAKGCPGGMMERMMAMFAEMQAAQEGKPAPEATDLA